jgi:hypothetical protein
MFPLMLALANPVNYGKQIPGKLPQGSIQQSAVSSQPKREALIGQLVEKFFG